MWSPTHIQVTVQRAKGLLSKGKNGTNNCFVTISVGKEKYQTSVKEKAETNVNWNEECELKIPDQGNRAELTLTCLHRNNLGIDEFLGQATLPLNEMDVYDRPRSKWLKLESKPGKEKKNKERGELEVRISFVVKSGSLTDLSKKDKHKSSIGQLASSVGGSLLSIGTLEKRKGIKKFAKSLGSKMHINGKKKHKEGDDVSISGSFASIGTPNSSQGGSSRRYGQRAGEADPGVISEDEDEFVFDNLSHKSSGSSLNIRSGLQAPTQNYVPHIPSPLLGLKEKTGGKQKLPKNDLGHEDDDGVVIDPELEQIENDFSVRARTLPPPSKPPRTMQSETIDEWETKLYGKHLDIGSSDSLKRRSWGQTRVPLPSVDDKIEAHDEITDKNVVETKNKENTSELVHTDSSSSSSESEEEEQEEKGKDEKQIPIPPIEQKKIEATLIEPKEIEDNKKPFKVESSFNVKPTATNLLISDTENNDFNELNASFARLEQKNRAKIFQTIEDEKRNTQSFIAHESQVPQAKPRNLGNKLEEKSIEIVETEAEIEQIQSIEKENVKNLQELRLQEQKMKEEAEAEALQAELRRKNEQKLREEKRREEDQMLLNFAKRSISVEDNDKKNLDISTESAKMETPDEKTKEKRMGKFKYFNRRDNKNNEINNSNANKSSERIIIGHEKSATHAERRSDMTAALAKKYEGKSREELMLIANGMENEALLQRQRVKELEDYLDNLLLRVMETHPKILQNPYSRTTSAKSG